MLPLESVTVETGTVVVNDHTAQATRLPAVKLPVKFPVDIVVVVDALLFSFSFTKAIPVVPLCAVSQFVPSQYSAELALELYRRAPFEEHVPFVCEPTACIQFVGAELQYLRIAPLRSIAPAVVQATPVSATLIDIQVLPSQK